MIENRKDSGVEWVGEIPESWNILPLGNCFTERNEKVSDYDWEPLSVTKQGILKQLESAAKSDAHDARKKVCKNDFVINSRSDRKQSCGVSPYDGSVSLINIVLENRFLNPDYVKYLLNNYGFAEEFYRWGTGIVADLWSTKWERMKKIMLPIPPVEVQSKIAKRLDDEIFKIDERITLTKQIIEDYKKYKQSLITETVTKGLNPDVEMKDSGVEWIGKIPEHWKVTKTLNALSMPITDGPHTTPELYDDGVPFISAEAVSCGNGKIDFEHMRGYISEEFYNECCKKYIPQIDDIYMIKSGATTGRVAMVDTDKKFTIWSPLAVFRVNTQIMTAKFLYYFVQSNSYLTQVELGWTYGTQQNIGMRTLETLKICIPTISEQQEIANYLDEKCTEIDNLISAKEQLIEDMENYKKSLIYEYVTGKKEVE